MQVNNQYSVASAVFGEPNRTAKTAASEANAAATQGVQNTLATYDFSTISPSKMLETVNKLITSGQVSLDETSALVPMMGGMLVAKPDEPMDFFAQVQKSIDYARYSKNEQAELYGNKALALLERFQGKLAQADITV